MEDIRDILLRRADTVGSAKTDIIVIIKEIITTRLRVEVRIIKLQHNSATISTEDAAAAGEIRLQKTQLLKDINAKITDPQQQLQNITIVIR